MTKEIDLSNLQQDEAVAKLNDEFNALERKEKLIVTSSENYYEVIKAFQQGRSADFIWAALLEGTPIYKGIIAKITEDARITRSVIEYMERDHKRCDDLYAKGESALAEGNSEEGANETRAFVIGMLRHFKIEEEILFPTFEENTGMVGGPTQVMRMEHAQMRELMTKMTSALDAGNLDELPGLGETMVILMQQHNMKEENMLYPMIETHLQDQLPSMISRAQLIDC